jgi:ABC-type Fe3+/spermidine/putrescine transport system ATPase subunit
VLLLDEPLASLDKQLRESMQVELRRIQEQIGITTILVTHNQTEALTMSDRIAVMNDGRFEQVGTPTEVYQQPATKFVADFIGTANVFDGTVQELGDGRVTVDCDGVEFEALAPDGVAVGDAVTVVTRPEHTVVELDTARSNVLEGEVSVSRFLGDHHECHVTLPSGTTVVGVVDDDGPAVAGGDKVSLGVDAEDCLVVVE